MGWQHDTPGPGGFESRRRRSSVPLPEERSRDSTNEDSGEIGCIPEEETGVAAHDRSHYSRNSQDTQVIERRCSCDQQELITAAAQPHLPRAHSPPTESSRTKRLNDVHREPPVTKNTLSELDVNKIVHNPKLRHDINFDPELHFRPNLDGQKGRRKTQKANEFWHTLCRQLELFITNRVAFEEEVGDAEWCLPSTLNAIRGILETLVPQRDRPSVEEIFNVDLLMQQFTKGVANLEKLALWLSQLLKSHCAPMRDEWVDEMVSQLSNGDRNGDVGLLVAGMRTLLGVLEAMKLDVANHQIRCLRPLLIEDTVPFEQKFFLKKIGQGRFDIGRAHTWFRNASCTPQNLSSESSGAFHGDIWIFMRALVNLMLPFRCTSPMPQTFMFDEERIIKLRSEMLDAINLEICMRLCQELDSEARSTRTTDMQTPAEYSPSPSQRSASPLPNLELSSPTLPAPEDFHMKPTRSGSSGSSSSSARQRRTAASAVRGRPLSTGRPLSMQFASRSSSTSSSLSTASSSTPISTPATPYTTITSSPPTANSLRTAIFAILGGSSSSTENGPTDSGGDARWKIHSPAIALQILRSTPTHLNKLPHFEDILKRHLSNPSSSLYQEAESIVCGNLFEVLSTVVSTYSPMTSLQVFEAATQQQPRGSNSLPQVGSSVWASQNSLNDVAVRIAHIGVLHWRVWAPLAYLVDPDGEGDGGDGVVVRGQGSGDDVDVRGGGGESQGSGAGQDSIREVSTEI